MTLPAEFAALVARQYAVATRQQLLEGGVSVSQLRWAMGRRWRMLLPRVVLLEPGLPSTQQRLMAALLFAGPDSWLGGMTAAAVHGLPGCTVAPPIQVLVPPHRTARAVAWVRVSRSYLLDERIVTRGPLRLSCQARALVDAAAGCPDPAAARALIIDAVQQRWSASTTSPIGSKPGATTAVGSCAEPSPRRPSGHGRFRRPTC